MLGWRLSQVDANERGKQEEKSCPCCNQTDNVASDGHCICVRVRVRVRASAVRGRGSGRRRRVGKKGKVQERRNEKKEEKKKKRMRKGRRHFVCWKHGHDILSVPPTRGQRMASGRDETFERKSRREMDGKWQSIKNCCLLIIHSIEIDQSDHDHCTWDGRKHASQQIHTERAKEQLRTNTNTHRRD